MSFSRLISKSPRSSGVGGAGLGMHSANVANLWRFDKPSNAGHEKGDEPANLAVGGEWQVVIRRFAEALSYCSCRRGGGRSHCRAARSTFPPMASARLRPIREAPRGAMSAEWDVPC